MSSASLSPMISICIPAYRRKDKLKRLLDSIADQAFQDYEIVITDDSPDNSVRDFVQDYLSELPIRYFQNAVNLGSPENWNEGIRMAKGQWIKIMHDDDWFTDENSLEKLVLSAQSSDQDFIFSAFCTLNTETREKKEEIASAQNIALILKDPVNLLKTNYIGHPSTTLIRNTGRFFYDRNLKWVVDLEYYIRILRATNGFTFIPETLVTLGLGNDQITASVFRNPSVEIPENIYLLNRIGVSSLRRIWAYDYYWRLIRNVKIHEENMLEEYNTFPDNPVPSILKTMVRQQSRRNAKAMQNGIYAKFFMVQTYLINRLKKRF